MSVETPIYNILKNRESLNLDFNEKRLMIMGLIKANFDLEAAYEINCKDQKVEKTTLEAYRKRLYYHGIGIKTIRTEVKKEEEILKRSRYGNQNPKEKTWLLSNH